MARIKYEVKTKVGKYTKDGVEKTRWHTMGKCFENDEGNLSIKVDSIPVNFDGWMSLFVPKPREDQQEQPQQGGNPSAMDDDIPF